MMYDTRRSRYIALPCCATASGGSKEMVNSKEVVNMRVMQFDDYGPPEVLHPAEIDTPAAGPGQLQIRVAATGVNPADYKWRGGMFRNSNPVKLPHVVGYDVAGTVTALGSGVGTFRLGDRVAASVRSGYAEFAVAAASACAKLPDGFDFAIAAALPCAGLTGVQMIEEGVRPHTGQCILITGATGAVGRFAVHAALRLGARVVAALRPAYFEEARRIGAHETIPLEGDNTGKLSFDHVADTVGGPAVAKLCGHLVAGGSIITVSTTPIDPTGLSTAPRFFAYHPDGLRLERLIDDVLTGVVAMPVARRLPLGSAVEAHRLMEAGGVAGKIILQP